MENKNRRLHENIYEEAIKLNWHNFLLCSISAQRQ